MHNKLFTACTQLIILIGRQGLSHSIPLFAGNKDQAAYQEEKGAAGRPSAVTDNMCITGGQENGRDERHFTVIIRGLERLANL